MASESNEPNQETTTEQEIDQVDNEINTENDNTEELLESDQDSDESPESELIEAQIKIKDYWEQIVRLNAEIENNRKRSQRDIENAHKYAVKGFVESLLPIMDSMELGLTAAEAENANMETIQEGVRMTMDLMVQTLEKHNIQSINPVGEKFDPELHQAMTMQEDADSEPNTVLNVMQKGYSLNGRLVRPAMVIVSK